MGRLTREQSREMTRERLRASALREISISGFTGASIDRICESAGFSRGAFYANFATKEELLLDIMRSFHDREADEWISLITSDLPMAQIIPTLRKRFGDYLADRERILFMSEVQLYAKRNQAFLERYLEDFRSVTIKAEVVLEAIFSKVGKRSHRPLPELAGLMRGLFAGLALDGSNSWDEGCVGPDLMVAFLEDVLELAEPL